MTSWRGSAGETRSIAHGNGATCPSPSTSCWRDSWPPSRSPRKTVLAFATIAGMVIFTWLTVSGMERLRLGFLERYESGFLGALILFLGVGIIFLGF